MLVNVRQTFKAALLPLALAVSVCFWAKNTKPSPSRYIQIAAAEREADQLFMHHWMAKCGDSPGRRTFTSCDGDNHLRMLDDALALGRQTKKHVLVEVGFEGCPPCAVFKNRLIKNWQASGRFSASVIVVPLDRYKLYQSHRSKLASRGITSFTRVPKFYLLNYATGSVIEGASGHSFGQMVMDALAGDDEFFDLLDRTEAADDLSQQ